MSLEAPVSPEHTPSYIHKIEQELQIASLIDELFERYQAFATTLPEEGADALTQLRRIRRYIKTQKEEVRELTKGSVLENTDCVTKSILAAALAKRLHVSVTIGRPKPLMNHFHTLLILPDGSFFKVAGRDRDYDVIPLAPEEVVGRMRSFGPALSLAARFKKKPK